MKIKEEDIDKYFAILGDREAYCVFCGRLEWNEARRIYAIPPNSRRKETQWVERTALSRILKKYADQGWAVWISLNEKETANDTIEGVKRIHAFWFDFDAEREDESRPATIEEREVAKKEAERFRAVMEDEGLRGFLACSGNGYHVYFPIHGYDLRGKVFRREFNQKQKEFIKKLRKKGEFTFDTTTDIRRVTQPIGYPNMKIPDSPVATYWVDDFGFEDIQEARGKNDQIIEAVLDTEIIQAAPPSVPSSRRGSENFKSLLEKDERLGALYRGNIELTYDKDVEKSRRIREETGKLVYTSRSEAELGLVTILCQEGFSGSEIYEIMAGCGIGKWQEKPASYHEITIIKAQAFAEERSREGRGRGRPPTKSEQRISYMGIILRDLMKRYTFVTPDDTKDIHVYDQGIYKTGNVLVESEVEGILGDDVDASFVSEVIGHIQRRTYVPRQLFNADRSLLPVKNGLLNLNTYELQGFDPSKIFTYQLPISFDPQARCPNIEAFIQSVLSPGNIPVVQEYVGYCLYPDMPAHKSLWLYGSGRNGKTTFVNLVRALLGDISTASVGLDELGPYHRFSKARLYGKLLNVVPEPTQREMDTIDFKRLVGGDFISAEVKNKQEPIDFVNIAKFIVYGNRFPLVGDTTEAFWHRVKTVEFPNTFIESAVPNYDKVLIELDGLSGFLNWCLEGLKRLKVQGFHFTESEESEDTKREFMRQSNSVSSFMDERCELKPSAYVPKEDLYNYYKDYCDEETLQVFGKKRFSQILGETPRVYSKHKQVKGRVQRCWVGIELKSDLEDTKAEKLVKLKPISLFGGQQEFEQEKIEYDSQENQSFVCDRCGKDRDLQQRSPIKSKYGQTLYVCSSCLQAQYSEPEGQYSCKGCGAKSDTQKEWIDHAKQCDEFQMMQGKE